MALVLLGLVTCALALGYGGNWLLLLPAAGPGRRVRSCAGAGGAGSAIALAVLAGAVSSVHDGWGALTIAYGTLLSTW